MELSDIKGVGPKILKSLNNLNINTIDDLLSYYPYRYEIFEPLNLTDDYNGERIAINVTIESLPTIAFIKKNFNRLQFRAVHNNKIMQVVIFNRAFMKQHLTINKTITLVGKYDSKKKYFYMR